MWESSLPPPQQHHPGAEEKAKYVGIPGVRFVPTDEELILDYLKAKVGGDDPPTDLVHEADVYEEHPKELTRRLGNSVEDFWYVFSKRDRKYPNGKRPSRSTGTDGRWKPVGQNKKIEFGAGKETIGHKCELAYEVFVHDDNQSQGSKRRSRRRLEKTEWKMYEFVAENTNKPISSAPGKMLLNDWVLCKITRKAGRMVEEQGGEQAAPLDELYDEDEQLQSTAQDLLDHVDDGADGSGGTEVGGEGFDADVEPPCDGDYLRDVPFGDCYGYREAWGMGDECGAQEPWNVHGDQFGDTDPMVNLFKVPDHPPIADLRPLEEVPTEPQSWDVASFLFHDESETVKPTEDGREDNMTAAAASATANDNKTAAAAAAANDLSLKLNF